MKLAIEAAIRSVTATIEQVMGILILRVGNLLAQEFIGVYKSIQELIQGAWVYRDSTTTDC